MVHRYSIHIAPRHAPCSPSMHILDGTVDLYGAIQRDRKHISRQSPRFRPINIHRMPPTQILDKF